TKGRPEKVHGISVGMKVSKLYFLHATHWRAPEGTTVGYYRVAYEDNSREKIPLVYGKDISDWWYKGSSTPPSRAKVAWEGDNDAAKDLDRSRIRLYMTTWSNPEPARKVVSIEFASTNADDAAPFCVAITAEE